MLLVANLANKNDAKNTLKWLKPWHMGTHLRVLSESYPINTNMTGFRWFQKTLHSYSVDESRLSIGRVKCSFQHVAFISYLHLKIVVVIVHYL